MILKIGNRASLQVSSFEEASRIYAQYRDASLEGASTFPDGTILDGGPHHRARVLQRQGMAARKVA